MDAISKETLLYLAYEYLPENISPFTRWVVFKIILEFGEETFDLPLYELSKKLQLYAKKLRNSLDELEDWHILEVGRLAGEKVGKRINRHFFESRRYSPDWAVGLEKWYQNRLSRIPQLRLFNHLINTRLNDFYISHQQAVKVPLLNKLDFKDALVLMTLVRNSNEFGITDKCGIHKLRQKTGLSKASLFRCIETLKNHGLIRARVDGVLKNSFIKNIEPFYVLNLSHQLWQDKATYGKFFIIEYPQPHQFEIEKIANLIAAFHKYPQGVEKYLDYTIAQHLQSYLNDVLPELRSDPLCLAAAPSPREHPQVYFQDMQSYLLANLLRLYSDLLKHKEGRYLLESLIQGLVPREDTTLKLNDGRANQAFLESYCEQWSSAIYNSPRKARELMGQLARVDLSDFQKIKPAALLPFVQRTVQELIPPEVRQSSPDQGIDAASQELMIGVQNFYCAVTALIANNHIYPFLMSVGNLHELGSFTIIPRHVKQRRYSCIFMPVARLKENQFFGVGVGHRFGEFANDPKRMVRMLANISSQDIEPTLHLLQEAGLLPAECRSIDDFALSRKVLM